MRRVIASAIAVTALTAAGTALAGQPATNSKGTFIDIDVTVTPPKAGTAKTPQGIGVTYDSFTGNRINGNAPDFNNDIVVRFNRGFVDNGAVFAACAINPKGYSKCSKASQIGTGVGEVSFAASAGAPPAFVNAKLTVYNGKPYKTSGPTLIFLAKVNGATAAELDFHATQRPSGPYSLTFSEIHFPGPPTATTSTITKFSFTVPRRSIVRKVRGKRVRTYLLQAPSTCRGGWKFAQTDSFSDGTPPLTATDTQSCVPAG